MSVPLTISIAVVLGLSALVVPIIPLRSANSTLNKKKCQARTIIGAVVWFGLSAFFLGVMWYLKGDTSFFSSMKPENQEVAEEIWGAALSMCIAPNGMNIIFNFINLRTHY